MNWFNESFKLCLVTATLAGNICAQQVGWQDPSRHRVQFVEVDRDVRLEVLDSGGSGRAVVLLAGYQTAHIYDDFAPKLAERFHVYGITRRGYGASSRPGDGYTAQRSAGDVMAVLGALKLERPVLAGHSWGGQDLNIIGAQYHDRVAGLVYLNSAEDATLAMSDYGLKPMDASKLPASMRAPDKPDFRSFQAYREWQLKTHGVAFPESESRQMYAANPDGTVGGFLGSQKVRDAIFAGRQKPDFARIRIPVLAFFASPASLGEEMEKHKPQNDDERAAMEEAYPGTITIWERHVRDLRAGVPGARVLALPDGNYYIFLSNQADIVREMRTFAETLH
jgi:pimeloyl-ACP methyl ester carboxylesterase